MLRRFELFGVYGEVFVKSIDQAFVTRDGVLGCLNFGNFIFDSRSIFVVHYINK